MQNIVYIHGLGATHRSFSYLAQNLPEHRSYFINYDSHLPLEQSCQQVARQLPKIPRGVGPENYTIIGHSLGGLIGLLLFASSTRAESIITIASPLGGSASAAAMRWLPGAPPVWRDIVPSSEYVTCLQNMGIKRKVLSIIATAGGSGFINEPNDSVVTLTSQAALPYGKKAEVKANHFEVLQHEKTVKLVKDFIFEKDTDENPIEEKPRTTPTRDVRSVEGPPGL